MVRLDERVENEGGGHLLLGKPVQQATEKHGFASSHFAGQEDQAFSRANSVGELVGGCASLVGEEQEAGIRIDFEGVLAQAEEVKDRVGHSGGVGAGARILGQGASMRQYTILPTMES